MININSVLKNAIENGALQTVTLYVNPPVSSGQSAITINQSKIMTGGLVIDRYSSSSNKIELGSAIAGSLTVKLDNKDGSFNNYVFEGAEIQVVLSAVGAEGYNVSLGYYTVDSAPRKLSVMTINALDRMMLFSKSVDPETISSWWVTTPTVSELLIRVCNACNVPLGFNASTLPNANYEIPNAPDTKNLTYRQMLQWISQIAGSNAYIDNQGRLMLSWYDTATSRQTIGTDVRYSSDINENSITVSGLQITDIYGNVALSGTKDYYLDISGNKLIQNTDCLSAMASRIVGFTYTPFEAVTFPFIALEPMDCVTVNRASGASVVTSLTNVNFVMNGKFTLKSKGETTQTEGYAAANPMTKSESNILEELERAQNETLNTQLQNISALNELIVNSLGVFRTEITGADGSVKFYIHDAPALEDSTNIWTITDNGIAWTNEGWNGGSPVWTYGITAAGDAMFRHISANGLTLSDPTNAYTTEITPNRYEIKYGNKTVTRIEEDEMIIPRTRAQDYLEVGKIRLVPHYINGVVDGTDIVFLD